MLEDFKTYRSVLDTYCEENNCSDDMDLMANAFETIEEMDDEEIDVALAIYRAANRLVNVSVVKYHTQADGPKKVANKMVKSVMQIIVQVIKEEVDLPVEIVETIISEFNGDFESFSEQLKTAKEAVKLGHGVLSAALPQIRPHNGGVNPSFKAVNGVLNG